jgi:hypothetical protein
MKSASMLRTVYRKTGSDISRMIVTSSARNFAMAPGLPLQPINVLGGNIPAKLFDKKNVRWMSTDPTTEGLDNEPTKPPPKSFSAAPTLFETEKVIGEVETHGFKAETRQLLDIVAKSLYHDKEVFIRELISNASDALEKARYLSSTNSIQDIIGALEVQISVDPDQKTFIIQDNGIGMNSQELMDNLGTIARSGSRAFLQEVSENESSDVAKNIIGKFGVGFYRFNHVFFLLPLLYTLCCSEFRCSSFLDSRHTDQNRLRQFLHGCRQSDCVFEETRI